jgi:hypothetical protein
VNPSPPPLAGFSTFYGEGDGGIKGLRLSSFRTQFPSSPPAFGGIFDLPCYAFHFVQSPRWEEEQQPLPLTGTLSLSPSKFECFWYLVDGSTRLTIKRTVNGYLTQVMCDESHRYIVTQFQWEEEPQPLPLTGALSLSPPKFECFWYLVKRTVNGVNELGGYVGCKF